MTERHAAYLARFTAEPVCFVRRKRPRFVWTLEGKLIAVRPPRPARLPGNALLSRLL